jgi:hypothetical protein
MATKEEALLFSVLNAPPELDFYFSHARGASILITLEFQSTKHPVSVIVDALNVLYDDNDERTDDWEIGGRFMHKPAFLFFEGGEYFRYALWGKFTGEYNKKTRKGVFRTYNYQLDKIR